MIESRKVYKNKGSWITSLPKKWSDKQLSNIETTRIGTIDAREFLIVYPYDKGYEILNEVAILRLARDKIDREILSIRGDD